MKQEINNEYEEKNKAGFERKSDMPKIESTISVSENGKWIIHRTIITDIKPTAYYEKVLSRCRQ